MSGTPPASNPAPAAPAKRLTMKDIAEQRKARHAIETGLTTKDQSNAAAQDYIEKQRIKKQIEDDKRKFDVNTDIAIARVDQRTKAEHKERMELVQKRVDEDQVRRQEEAILREEALARIRAQKEKNAQAEHEKRLARQAAIQAGTLTPHTPTNPVQAQPGDMDKLL